MARATEIYLVIKKTIYSVSIRYFYWSGLYRLNIHMLTAPYTALSDGKIKPQKRHKKADQKGGHGKKMPKK
jgi:hypothetical protein